MSQQAFQYQSSDEPKDPQHPRVIMVKVILPSKAALPDVRVLFQGPCNWICLAFRSRNNVYHF